MKDITQESVMSELSPESLARIEAYRKELIREYRAHRRIPLSWSGKVCAARYNKNHQKKLRIEEECIKMFMKAFLQENENA